MLYTQSSSSISLACFSFQWLAGLRILWKGRWKYVAVVSSLVINKRAWAKILWVLDQDCPELLGSLRCFPRCKSNIFQGNFVVICVMILFNFGLAFKQVFWIFHLWNSKWSVYNRLECCSVTWIKRALASPIESSSYFVTFFLNKWTRFGFSIEYTDWVLLCL